MKYPALRRSITIIGSRYECKETIMTNLTKIVAAGILAVVVILGGLAYSVLRAPQQASSPITAIPLAASTASPAASPVASPSTATAAPDATETTQTPAAEATATGATAAASAPAAASGTILAQIVQEESEARFIIDEVLNNAPKTVVGTTNQVAGEIAVNPSDPSQTRVGTIQVNARTLTTDSDFRNRAIKNQILATDQYEFVTFTPKQITGLPQQAAPGQEYTFQIAGDLTIRDTTKEVTFDVTAKPVSTTRLEGTAKTTIKYADYGVTIPQVRQVASVDEQVRLEIDFVAVPK
jgi:polyisoprenoid-binding protein YceI